MVRIGDFILENTFEIIIIDSEVEDFFRFISDIRKNNITTPIVTLSHLGNYIENSRVSYRAGADECIMKPISAENFILRIDHYIEHNKMINSMKK